MADFAPTTWVDDAPPSISAEQMNRMEAGIEDAAEHNKRGTLGSRPAAAAANKNWLWQDSSTGALYYSDGSSWYAINPPDSSITNAMMATGATGLQAESFSAYRSASTTTVAVSTATKIPFDTEEFDPSSRYDNVTNFRWTPAAGKYRVNASLQFLETMGATKRVLLWLYKNGALFRRLWQSYTPTGADDFVYAGTTLVAANGTDYFEVWVHQGDAATRTIKGTSESTFFQGELIGRD